MIATDKVCATVSPLETLNVAAPTVPDLVPALRPGSVAREGLEVADVFATAARLSVLSMAGRCRPRGGAP
jgi:hypothetical protein